MAGGFFAALKNDGEGAQGWRKGVLKDGAKALRKDVGAVRVFRTDYVDGNCGLAWSGIKRVVPVIDAFVGDGDHPVAGGVAAQRVAD